jgi:serine/threonine protein phosphatase PrpC
MNQKPATLWRVVGKSIIGATHTRAGKPCQDAILWREGDSFVVLAVADGHGSERSPHSDKGAHIAVEVAVRLLNDLYTNSVSLPTRLSTLKHYAEDQFPHALVRDWIERVKADHSISVMGKIQSEKDVLVQYGSTLLAILITPEFLLFLQLGDGDILTVANDGIVTRPIPKDKRLIANETTSLSTPHAWREVQVVFQPLLEELPTLILLSTDGYANSFVSEQDFLKVGVDYLELIREQGLEQVAFHLDEWLTDASIRGSGDDITLGLAFRDALG